MGRRPRGRTGADHLERMEISPERVLNMLARGERVAASALAERVAATYGPVRDSALRDALDALERSGVVHAVDGAFERSDETGRFVGRVRFAASGRCFVAPIADDFGYGEVEVREAPPAGAAHGDVVVVRVDARGRGGLIVAVLRRAGRSAVGRFTAAGRSAYVIPADGRFAREIDVEPRGEANAVDGDLVCVEIVRDEVAGRPPLGRVVEVLGREGDPRLDVEIIVRKHALPSVFPADALAEAAGLPSAISEAEIARRRDFRGALAVTIDGATARDFDDAVSLEPLPSNLWRLGVHIADVGFYVREGTALDAEALRRGTSVYFPDRAIPMLPERLSNDLCSLVPRADRLTMSALMDVDAEGVVRNYWVGPSVIHSAARMTYDAVDAALRGAPDTDDARRLAETFRAMNGLARVLAARRRREGAIDFDLPEAVLELDAEGRTVDVRRAPRTDAHRLVEQFMLLANETVAGHLTALGVPLPYRVHEPPLASRVAEFASVAAAFGYGFPPAEAASAADFQRLAERAAGKPEARMLSRLMLRSLRQARYAARNAGHFGLAAACYTHFTSPIRRYPDLVVHRALRGALDAGAPATGPVPDARGRAAWQLAPERARHLAARLDGIAELSSERERAADEAERELVAWKRAELMRSRLGDEFDAVVTSVRPHGLFVDFDDVFVEGFAHISTFADDDYVLREKANAIVGRRTGRQYALGDAVRVRVDRVDRGKDAIDVTVVGGGRLVPPLRMRPRRSPTR